MFRIMGTERFKYNGTDHPELIGSYNDILSSRVFFDANQDPLGTTDYVQITGESLVIPETGLVELDHYPYGNPLEDDVMSLTIDGTTATKFVGAGTVAPGTVRVFPRRPYLDFSTDDAGDTVLVNYRAGGSMPSGAALTEMSQAIRALAVHAGSASTMGSGNFVLNSVQASEAIALGSFVRVFWDTGKLKMAQSKATSDGVSPDGYSEVAVTSGSYGAVIVSGLVTTLGERVISFPPPIKNTLYASSYGDGGYYTYDGDSTPTALVEGDGLYPVAKYLGGGFGIVDCSSHKYLQL